MLLDIDTIDAAIETAHELIDQKVWTGKVAPVRFERATKLLALLDAVREEFDEATNLGVTYAALDAYVRTLQDIARNAFIAGEFGDTGIRIEFLVMLDASDRDNLAERLAA